MSTNSKLSLKVKQLLQEGFSYHQKGQFNEAQKIYEKILEREPKNFNAPSIKCNLISTKQKIYRSAQFF